MLVAHTHSVPVMQAAQVRKSCIGGLGSGGYHPNTQHAYTVHSGTNVEQVSMTHELLDVHCMVHIAVMCILHGTDCRRHIIRA